MKKRHAYTKEILKLSEKLGPGKIVKARVYHDDWCAFLTDKHDTCNCNPEVVVESVMDKDWAQ